MGLNGSGQEMIEVVLRFFEEEHWHYQKIDKKPLVRAGYRGERGTWVCYARIDVEKRRFIFHAVTGMNIPVQYRTQVIEYLNRVNCGLTVGSFELDVDSGDVRFRAGIEIPDDGELSIGQVRSVAYTSVHTLDHYFPGVMSVVHGGLSPEAALARTESLIEETWMAV